MCVFYPIPENEKTQLRENKSYLKARTTVRIIKIQRRDGNENVALKVNLRFFFSLYSDYSYPLTLSNVGEPSWSWISRDHIQAQKEKKFRRCLFTSSIKREIRHFHVVVVPKRNFSWLRPDTNIREEGRGRGLLKKHFFGPSGLSLV